MVACVLVTPYLGNQWGWSHNRHRFFVLLGREDVRYTWVVMRLLDCHRWLVQVLRAQVQVEPAVWLCKPWPTSHV